MTVLGIDYGTKRIGIAKSDALGMFAHGVGHIENTDEKSVFEAIKAYCQEFATNRIVVGLPKQLDGTIGIAAEKVLAFVEKLKGEIDIEVTTWDERLTSKSADRYMTPDAISNRKKRKKIDQLAAQIMLQGYLDCKRY
ncbi:MAG: Holliday junction resolvase RuvX [Candidatus Omnitrophica bacterium]|nr:Holliday junction resolvase RuvX [Candidatus Omnitrophota bacterium]